MFEGQADQAKRTNFKGVRVQVALRKVQKTFQWDILGHIRLSDGLNITTDIKQEKWTQFQCLFVCFLCVTLI